MWCNGLKPADELKPADDHDGSDIDDAIDELKPSKKKKSKKSKDVDEINEAVDASVKDLKKLHPGYTPMQYRIWAEMLNGGTHCSMDNPPTSSMFVRCGNGTISKKKPTSEDSFSKAITQIASALSPQAGTGSGSIVGTSPAKLIESRSKCYKQLADLSNLKQSGLLDNEEYLEEREAIMKMLTKLKN